MASPAREERSSRQRVSCGRKTRARDGGGLRDNLGYGSGSFPREETGQRRATLSSAAGGNGVQDEGGDTGCDLVFHRRAGGLPDVVVVVVLDVAGEDSIVGRSGETKQDSLSMMEQRGLDGAGMWIWTEVGSRRDNEELCCR
uniref:DUF834 domain-containing protein n=1 Tax=Oryza rufipogon TaxID=4529 RepID=A0A0E0QGI2_ORYRU